MLRSLIPAILATVILSSSCTTKQSVSASSTEVQPLKKRRPAADFVLTDSNGQNVRLSDYKGKVVLLNFWATWCGPCQVEIPWFVEFEKQYKSKGFAVVGVSMDDDGWKVVKPYIEDHKLNYRILLGNDTVTQLYGGVESLPTTFVIDKDGNVAFPPHVGLVSKSEYANEIQSLLGGQQNVSLPARSSFSFALLTGAAK